MTAKDRMEADDESDLRSLIHLLQTHFALIIAI
jgi:hypothetical protein